MIVKCKDCEGECFARLSNNACTVLNKTPERVPCPFKKRSRDITDGEFYPYKEHLLNHKLRRENKHARTS